MKLSTKLLLSYSAIAFLVLLVGVTSFLLNDHVKEVLIDESRHSMEEIHNLVGLNFHLQNSLIFTRNYLFEREREQQRPSELQHRSRRAEQAARASLESFTGYLEAFEPGVYRSSVPEMRDGIGQVHRELNQSADTLTANFEIYRSLVLDLFELEEETGLGNEIYNLTIEPYYRTTLLPLLEQVHTDYRTAIELKMGFLEARVERNTLTLSVMTLVAFIFALGLAYLIYHSISRPLRYLTQATEDIGSGNLSRRIHIKTNDELQHLGDSFNQMAENLNSSMVSKGYVDSIIQSMGDMLIVTNERFEIELVNRSTTESLGYRESDLIGGSIWNLFDGAERGRLMKHIKQNNERVGIESSLMTRNRRALPVLLSFSGLDQPEASSSDKIVFVASNITVQKEAEDKISRSLKEKEVLLSEIHHRVKNNLAVISGLLEMQLWNLTEQDVNVAPLKESQLRIQSIALVHELLYQSENFSEIELNQYIHKLLKAIQKTHRNDEKKITILTDAQQVFLTIQKAIPASLMLNELVVNAYKHAFRGRNDGSIHVHLTESGGVVTLVVEDDGVGIPENFDPFSQKSLGMTLIKTLIRQIGATISIDEADMFANGTKFTIRFENNS